jgi:hypothetical protein
MVEVLIEEMSRSDRSRPRDYETSRGRRCRANKTNKTTLRSERRSALKNNLTGPTLLEMSGLREHSKTDRFFRESIGGSTD